MDSTGYTPPAGSESSQIRPPHPPPHSFGYFMLSKNSGVLFININHTKIILYCCFFFSQMILMIWNALNDLTGYFHSNSQAAVPVDIVPFCTVPLYIQQPSCFLGSLGNTIKKVTGLVDFTWWYRYVLLIAHLPLFSKPSVHCLQRFSRDTKAGFSLLKLAK